MSAASLSTLALALGVVRALVWVLLTIVIGCVMTLVMFVGYPVMKLIDPTLYWYQRLLCFGAEINLRMFTRITILVRARRRTRSTLRTIVLQKKRHS